MLHLLRPLLKQTVTYRYLRGREVVAHGTGWVERIVTDAPDTSTYFTPLAITLNIDSFEHLEFETRPDSSSSTRPISSRWSCSASTPTRTSSRSGTPVRWGAGASGGRSTDGSVRERAKARSEPANEVRRAVEGKEG